MNMMLTNVTERIREIGIRRALGASRRDITAQFLAESSALCITGGILGVVIGYLLAGAHVLCSELGHYERVRGHWDDYAELLHYDRADRVCRIGRIGVIFGFYPPAAPRNSTRGVPALPVEPQP